MLQSFFEQLLSSYADVISSFAIPMVIAIFAFAFPLLFQTASRIDDKYNSTLLIKVFRKDKICKWFIFTLIIALVCCCIWGLQMPRCVNFGKELNVIIDNSALILLFVSTIILIVFTITIMWLMYVYYMPKLLFERLKKKYDNSTNSDKSMLFMAISKLMHYAIKKSDSELSFSTLQFYFDEFKAYREDKKNEICTYPEEFYRIINETNELVYMEPKKETSFFNESVMLGLLIDEYQGTILSEETYREIWKGMRQALYYNREDFIVAYWRKAHQYMNFCLGYINTQYDERFNVTNQANINRRNAERERFLEFHYALGGLLMMKQKYILINQLTTWTNQTPPKYVLVPETMEEVIKRFMEVEKNGVYINPVYYEQRYPFPDISGVNANDIIKMWIKRYIAILFLRQYTLHKYFIYSRTLEMPNPPQTLSEKRQWDEELDVLKSFVSEYLLDERCLKAMNMEALNTPDWFAKNNKPKPEDLIEHLIEHLKSKVEDSYEQTKINQPVDSKKVEQLNNATKRILSRCFEYYEKLFPNSISDNDPHKSLLYGGRYEVFDKMAFASDQDMGYSNFDSIFAEMIAAEFRNNMPSVFRVYYETNYYLLNKKDIFAAIDNLQLDSEQYTIVSVGIDLSVIDDEQEIKKYKGIPILELGSTRIDAVNNSLFVMQNKDLPSIIHNDIDTNVIQKYYLNSIDDKYHIYTNVIDLHNSADIQNEVKEKTNIQNLDKSVLVCVDVNTEVRCKINAKCIQLKVFSQFDNIGNPNKIEDVKNIWNK